MSDMELYYVGIGAIFALVLFVIIAVEKDPVLVFGLHLILMFCVLVLAVIPWVFIALAWLFDMTTTWLRENIWLVIFLCIAIYWIYRKFANEREVGNV